MLARLRLPSSVVVGVDVAVVVVAVVPAKTSTHIHADFNQSAFTHRINAVMSAYKPSPQMDDINRELICYVSRPNVGRYTRLEYMHVNFTLTAAAAIHSVCLLSLCPLYASV